MPLLGGWDGTNASCVKVTAACASPMSAFADSRCTTAAACPPQQASSPEPALPRPPTLCSATKQLAVLVAKQQAAKLASSKNKDMPQAGSGGGSGSMLESRVPGRLPLQAGRGIRGPQAAPALP